MHDFARMFIVSKITHNTKPARLAEVAAAAGVSASAAGTVLNVRTKPSRVSPKVAEHIRKVAAKLNYIPNFHARSIRVGRTETIAVAMDFKHPRHPARPFHPYWAHMLGAIDAVCRNNGFQMTIVGPNDTTSAIDRGVYGIHQKRFDGMIVFGTTVQEKRTNLLSDPPSDLALVIIQPLATTSLPTIDFEAASGTRMAVEHLVQLGHRSLLWIGPENAGGGPEKIQLVTCRQDSFIQATAQQNITGTVLTWPVPWFDFDEDTPDQPTHTQAFDALEAYLKTKHPPFTGVVCYNDETAIGVYGALAQAGLRVPQDISVVGFDDTLAYLCIPPLTTVSHRFVTMGEEAARMVLEMVRKPKACQAFYGTRRVIEPELVIRSSTAIPAHC